MATNTIEHELLRVCNHARRLSNVELTYLARALADGPWGERHEVLTDLLEQLGRNVAQLREHLDKMRDLLTDHLAAE